MSSSALLNATSTSTSITNPLNQNTNSNKHILNPLSSITTTASTSISISSNSHRYVKLNVGGRLFSTSLDTLTKQDNMLRAMFSGRMDVTTDLDGYILIDRCGKHFEFILNYLRDEDTLFVNMNLDEFRSEIELYELLKEAKFYCIQPLINLIEQKIFSLKSNLNEPYYGSSIVSMITSKNELIKILNSTDKPCIRLLINRHNNKYSYTNTSDDNLLKNIELFERMAIKFKNRIMFIKDTTSNEEICCWYFHGGGKKLAEVCCTSIVYTTEKKQTKVEFPDSKILEEIFVNAVLFESKENINSNDSSNQAFVGNDDETLNIDEMPPRINLTSTNGIGIGVGVGVGVGVGGVSTGLNSVNSSSGANLIVNSALNAVSSAINNINLNGSANNSSNINSQNVNLTNNNLNTNNYINNSNNNVCSGLNSSSSNNNMITSNGSNQLPLTTSSSSTSSSTSSSSSSTNNSNLISIATNSLTGNSRRSAITSALRNNNSNSNSTTNNSS